MGTLVTFPVSYRGPNREHTNKQFFLLSLIAFWCGFHLLRRYDSSNGWVNNYEALVQCHWLGKTETLGRTPIPLLLPSPQITKFNPGPLSERLLTNSILQSVPCPVLCPGTQGDIWTGLRSVQTPPPPPPIPTLLAWLYSAITSGESTDACLQNNTPAIPKQAVKSCLTN
jgi:hypothetical protein